MYPQEPEQIQPLPFEEILTPEEIRSVLRIACENKLAEQRLIEYNRKIREPEPKVVVSAEDYYKWVIEKAKENIKDFKISKEEEKLYKLLSLYFTEDKRLHGESFRIFRFSFN
jgi:hypothetical protein